MIDISSENLNKDNDRYGIYILGKGLDPKKYFRKISPYDANKPEVIAALEKELLEEYDRDQEKAERERVREEAEYQKNLEYLGESKREVTIAIVLPENNPQFITKEHLQRFWDARPNERQEVIKSIFAELGFLELSAYNLPSINFETATYFEHIVYWLIKLYLPFEPPQTDDNLLHYYRNDANRILDCLQHHLLSIPEPNQQTIFLMQFWIILQGADEYTKRKKDQVLGYISYVITKYIGKLSNTRGNGNRFSLEYLQVKQGIVTFAQFLSEDFEETDPPDNLILQWIGSESLIYRLAYGFLYSKEMENYRSVMQHGDAALFIKRFVSFFGIQTDNSDPANKVQNLPQSPFKTLKEDFKTLEEGLDNYENSKSSKGKNYVRKSTKSK